MELKNIGECAMMLSKNLSSGAVREKCEVKPCAIIMPGGYFGAASFFAGLAQPCTVIVGFLIIENVDREKIILYSIMVSLKPLFALFCLYFSIFWYLFWHYVVYSLRLKR